uniref:Uncharacterized protein n=1 Tax=Amphimedon queenslandica TaxID=400682 RepID=A0A1X7V3M2_AMPQE
MMMSSILTNKEPPNLGRDIRNMFISLVMKNCKDSSEILSVKFVKAPTLLVVQQHHCQKKQFLLVLMMTIMMGTVHCMPFHVIVITQNYELRKAIIVTDMPTLKQNCLILQ